LGAWVLEDLIRQAAEAGHSMFVAVCEWRGRFFLTVVGLNLFFYL
jgi:hypothetical protein